MNRPSRRSTWTTEWCIMLGSSKPVQSANRAGLFCRVQITRDAGCFTWALLILLLKALFFTPNQLQTDRNETQVLTYYLKFKEDWGKLMKSIELGRQNEVDWTWKVKITNAEFLAVGKAYMYTYKSLLWPTPYLKGNFKTSLKLRDLSFIIMPLFSQCEEMARQVSDSELGISVT